MLQLRTQIVDVFQNPIPCDPVASPLLLLVAPVVPMVDKRCEHCQLVKALFGAPPPSLEVDKLILILPIVQVVVNGILVVFEVAARHKGVRVPLCQADAHRVVAKTQEARLDHRKLWRRSVPQIVEQACKHRVGIPCRRIVSEASEGGEASGPRKILEAAVQRFAWVAGSSGLTRLGRSNGRDWRVGQNEACSW